ncbi:hypothetical protein SRHO_G00220480 [Serrasalmus rhombeus]
MTLSCLIRRVQGAPGSRKPERHSPALPEEQTCCDRAAEALLCLMKRDSVTGRGDAGARRPRNADAPLNLAFLIQLSPQVEAVPEGLGAAGSH